MNHHTASQPCCRTLSSSGTELELPGLIVTESKRVASFPWGPDLSLELLWSEFSSLSIGEIGAELTKLGFVS